MKRVILCALLVLFSAATLNAEESRFPDLGNIDLGGLGAVLEALQKPAASQSQYQFDIVVKAEVMDYGRNKQRSLTYAVSDDAIYAEIDADRTMVMDFVNESMVTIDPQKGTKQVMSTALFKQAMALGKNFLGDEMASFKVDNVSKVGESQPLLGYETELWRLSSEDNQADARIATAIDFDLAAYGDRVAKMFGMTPGALFADFSEATAEIPNGLPLHMINYENGKKDTELTVTSVDESGMTLDLSAYRSKSMLGN